jgi:hypothetical protein
VQHIVQDSIEYKNSILNDGSVVLRGKENCSEILEEKAVQSDLETYPEEH